MTKNVHEAKSNKFEISKYIESVGLKLVSDFEDAREHGADSNAKGFAMESVTRKKLESLLPSMLGVGQGYIIDSNGNTSRQIDLVLFERNLCPVFSIHESPESTYYPCEGVVAAIEIKSVMGKKEFEDSCEKANSIRKLQRKFEVVGAGVTIGSTGNNNVKNRRYGQVGHNAMHEGFDPNKSYLGDILAGVITGRMEVKQDTVESYYDQAQRNAPDLLVSLDGICGNFATESDIFTNARLGRYICINKKKHPFSRLIEVLYFFFCNGRTTSFESFFSYFHSANEE